MNRESMINIFLLSVASGLVVSLIAKNINKK